MVESIAIGVFVTLVIFAGVGVALVNKWKVFAIFSTIIFFILALLFTAQYNVVMKTNESSTVENATNGQYITKSNNDREVVLIDSQQTGVGYIFFAFGLITLFIYFSKLMGA